MPKDTDATIIKKYANRRLYHTGTSTYVTLQDLAEMIRRDEAFVVSDARTGEDLTHLVLTQIIFELENQDGQSLMPCAFMRQLIRLYGKDAQGSVPFALEQAMADFCEGRNEKRGAGAQAAYDKSASDAAPGDFKTMREELERMRRRLESIDRALPAERKFRGDTASLSPIGK
ncbi:polyhydroxyalkanoate synthesis repressor PhaR [Consotaella salsifontis]|uniref:Polyhydroxyalkanoate synthesis repressor PhaR n=1 Tax=Consotaella salsifontis TaxID=1365950 RepID=A0A1T4SQG2_9HYPH|nr:polyhydroxyalkanoate synthesis repressor PhaR [Consotaella salsifontis]SKA30386.1 polyhydroxyalkanoate synthesis repressor PhaR [Consotaella salsifontis]